MDEKNNIVDINSKRQPTSSVDTSINQRAKYHSNPIFKKYFVINAQNNSHKFKVSDLFE